MKLTDAKINDLHVKDVDYRVKCTKTPGLSIKVTPTGRKSFIVDGRIKGGRTRRFTIGTHPSLSASDAREEAQHLISMMQRGEDPKEVRLERDAIKAMQSKTLATTFEEFLSVRNLKPKTVKDYQGTLRTVFAAWLNKPINKITRKDVTDLFVDTRDNRGQATAVKAFRILSAIINFAKADDVGGVRLLTENPVDVLKEKRVDRNLSTQPQVQQDPELL